MEAKTIITTELLSHLSEERSLENLRELINNYITTDEEKIVLELIAYAHMACFNLEESAGDYALQYFFQTGNQLMINEINRLKKIYNPGCLSCHTTGFGHREGFITIEQTPERANVACTECHYYPSEHIQDPDVKTLPIDKAVCIRCHNSRNSPDFDYKTYMSKIVH